MSATDDLKLAFRAYVADGIPSSGAYKPEKAEINSAFDKLGAELSAIGNGLLRYDTKSAMDANTTATDGQLAYVWDDGTAANNTVYQSDAGVWSEATWYFDAVSGVVQPLVDEANAAAAEAEEAVTALGYAGSFSVKTLDGRASVAPDSNGDYVVLSINGATYGELPTVKAQLGVGASLTAIAKTLPDMAVDIAIDDDGVWRVRSVLGGAGQQFFGTTDPDANEGASLPSGGVARQIIVKQSDANGDALWGAAPQTAPAWADVSGVATTPLDRAFSADGATSPIYSATVYPSAEYYPDIDQTLFAWEGWDPVNLWRVLQVRAWSHSLGKWSDVYRVGVSPMVDDDHGVPAICRDHNGYFHLFGGNHIAKLQHWRSVRPNDPREWVRQAEVEADRVVAYPHPVIVGAKLVLFTREKNVSGNYPTRLLRYDVNADGSITRDYVATAIAFDSDYRMYVYKVEPRDDRMIDAVFVRATAVDTRRVNVYFAVLDPSTMTFSNIDGTRSGLASLSETEADTNFRLVATIDADDYFAMGDFCRDAKNPDVVHLLWNDPDEPAWKYQRWEAGVGGSITTVYASAQDRSNGTVTARPGGGCDLWFVEYLPGTYDEGGNIRRVTVDADGALSPARLVAEPEGARGLARVVSVRRGQSSALVYMAEAKGGTPSAEDGALRCYAEGDRGPLFSPHVGSTIEIDDGGTALTPDMPASTPIAMVRALSPVTNEPALSIDGDFDIVDGYLVATDALTEGVYFQTITAEDGGSTTIATKRVAIHVTVNEAYSFSNAEAESFVEATGYAWPLAHMGALDDFVSALKSAGVWTKLDVLVPPGAMLATGLIDIKGTATPSLHHANQPISFSRQIEATMPVPTGPWKTSGENNYVDSGFNPSTAGGSYAQNSATIVFRQRAAAPLIVQPTEPAIGYADAGQGSSLLITDTALTAKINQANATVGTLAAGRDGLFAVNRSSSGAVQLYRNGAALALTSGSAEASVAIANGNILIGKAGPSNGYAATGFEGFAIGGSLSAGEHEDLADAWLAYEAALGLD